jgi:hypothetical protein
MSTTHTMSRRAGIALTLLLLAGATARADLIQWGYNWSSSAAKITADGGGSGYLTLTNQPSASAAGTSNTVITNLHDFSTATSASPDVFTHAAFSFTLQLEDLASKTTGTVTFSGFFSGTLTANSANILANFTSPTTQTVTIGGNTYTVTLGTYSPPGPPGSTTNAGSLNAIVTPSAGTGGGHTSGGSSPEPSTLVLASLAFPYLGLAGWRRRKRRQQTPAA